MQQKKGSSPGGIPFANVFLTSSCGRKGVRGRRRRRRHRRSRRRRRQ